MKKIVLIFSLLTFCEFAVARNGFLGNPGRGIVLASGEIYLQDLFSVNAHESPYVGSTVAPLFNNSALPELEESYAKDILARKLTDINLAIPGLGQYILLSLSQYDLVFIEESLKTIPDDNDSVALPEGAKYIQLATRFQNSIRINKTAWRKMSPAHQVALLIHEALFSLTTPVRLSNGYYEQPSRVATEITGHAFRRGFENSGTAALLRSSPEEFGMNVNYSILPEAGIKNVNMAFETLLGNDIQSLRHRLETRHFSSAEDWTTIEMQMHKACTRAFLFKNSYQRLVIQVDAKVTNPTVKRIFYPVSDVAKQMALQFGGANTSSLLHKEVLEVPSSQDCQNEISEILRLTKESK